MITRLQARAAQIRAEGAAQADIIRAQGAHTAAEKLASSSVAVELARLDKVRERFSFSVSVSVSVSVFVSVSGVPAPFG